MKDHFEGFREACGFEASFCERYRCLRIIGTGSMGTVVLARDLRRRRLVALKFLRERCSVFLERLRREARLMQSLEHPSIVRVLGFEEGDGRAVLVLEYVGGGSLALARFSPAELVRTLRGVVDALAYLHANGIVHRDVKPDNVLLVASGSASGGRGSGDRGRALLTDFGLALERGEGLAPGPVAGTLFTMSPEQARGDAIGPASDQFSLGVTLYRQLTGEWPFRGRTVADVMCAIEHEAPVPPRVLATGIPAALEQAVLRALEKEPSRRFPSMEDLGAALDGAFPSRPLQRFFSRLREPTPNEAERRRMHPPSYSQPT